MMDVLKYIHEHIRSPIQAGDVARQFGYSKWYFCTQFRNYTGKTFVEYVRYYRMQLAAQDLLAGEKELDVAMNCGYETLSGFSKAFRNTYGCLPMQFLKKARENQERREKERAAMFQLSDRCVMLREEAVNLKSHARYVCMQREVYFTLGKAEAKAEGLENTEIIAGGVARTIESFMPVIMPGELLVGFNYGDGPTYGEYCHVNDDEAGRSLLKDNGISNEDMRRYFEVRDTEDSEIEFEPALPLTEAEAQAEKEWAAIGHGTDSNHTIIGYEKVLRLGFEGLLKEVEACEAENGSNPMYRGMKRICRAACRMGERYADRAEQLLRDESGKYRREDLEKIIRTCRRAPRYPAGTLLEAAQALWFAHILNTWEDHINANSLGRLDQILYPYYVTDIESGLLTKEEAFEIICCLWIKLYCDYDVQQSCVGGSSPDGRSMVNDLSYMMLDATEQLDFVRCLSVRFSASTEKNFMRRALEVVGRLKKGVPFFFNDDAIVPSLIRVGIAPEDASNYSQIGCVETAIPGKSNPHADTGDANLLKALEYALCDGHSMMYPEFRPGVATGELSQFRTYEQFRDAVMVQVRRLLELTCARVDRLRTASVKNAPKPVKSLLTEGCLESGRDFNNGGAKYDYYQIMLSGVPNLADSLMVIKKYVFRDRKYTLEQLREILEGNFEDEAVRQEFINKASKYGNDIDEVDNIAVDIISCACDILDDLSVEYGVSFHAQPFTYLWMIDHGRQCAASPDGRRRGDNIAYSCSAMQGRDFNGLTAMFNSLSKLPTRKTAGATSAIVEVDPKLYCDSNIGILTDILLVSARRGLCNVQFSTVDVDTLIAARQNPEKYNNLAVRVSGFSQRFNLLSPDLQEHIIGRTKHKCM